MILRMGASGEEEALAVLVELAFRDYLRGIGRDGTDPRDWLPARLADGEVEVAEANGRLLGMAALSRNAVDERLTVDLLAVDPVAQGCGIGRLLLSHAERLARQMGARSMHLHTVARYDHLVRLYEGAGFEATHHGPRPKGCDGHPRVFFRKRLDTEDLTA